jgi:TP901 family phage tail tape measure protein
MIVADLLTQLGFNYNPAELNRFQSDMKAAAKQTALTAATMATTFFSAFIGVSAKKFSEFEAQTNQTIAVLDNVTQAQADALEKQALALGSSTKFSAKEAAAAQSELAKAGMDFNAVIVATEGALSLAAAAGVEVAQAAKISSGIIAGFGLESKDASLVADILAQAANKSATGVNEIGEAMKYTASSAKLANQDFGDIAALASVLGNNMIEGSMAGTTLSGMLTRLQSPVGKAKDLIKAYGIETHNSNGEMLNIVDIISSFQKATKKLSQQKQSELFKSVFGEEAGRGAATIINTNISKIKELQASMKNASGAAGEMASKMNRGLGASIEQMSGAIESLLIVIGKEFAPVISGAAKFVSGLAEEFVKSDPIVKTITASLLGAAAALSSLVAAGFLINTLIPSITMVKNLILATKLATLGMWAAWALGAVVIGLLINDIYTFFTGGDSMLGRLASKSQVLTEALNYIRDSFMQNKEAIRNFGYFAIELFKQFLNGVVSIAVYLGQYLPPIIEFLVVQFVSWYKGVMGIVGAIQGLGTIAGDIFLSITNFVNGVITVVDNLATSIGNVISAFSGGGFSAGINAIANLLPTFPSLSAATAGNNINSTVQVSVGGSNATPSQIAGAVVAGNNKSLRGQLATSARNQPKVVR